MKGRKVAILRAGSYKLCLTEGAISLLLAIPTSLALLRGLPLLQETSSTEAISPARQAKPCSLSSCAGPCSSQEEKAAPAGASPVSGICVLCIKPSCSAGASLLSLARAANLQPNAPRFGSQRSPPAASIWPRPSFGLPPWVTFFPPPSPSLPRGAVPLSEVAQGQG